MINDNPLAPTVMDLVLTPEEEEERKAIIIDDAESLREVAKRNIAIKRAAVLSEVESRKLDSAKQFTSLLEKGVYRMLAPETIEAIPIKDAKDLYYMAKAMGDIENILNNLTKSQLVDDGGGAKVYKIECQFGNNGSKAVIEMRDEK